MKKIKLTLVAPVYNEEAVIGLFHERTSAVLDSLEGVEANIIYVVDRCTDNTLDVLRDIIKSDCRTTALALSSRFGHQMSLLAGIERGANADAILMMDSDLQHPPELIPKLLAHFRGGADVVYTVRKDTEDVGKLRKLAGNVFYAGLNRISEVKINPNAADFRLVSGRVANVLVNDFAERNMFLRGLFSWIGFSQVGVEYVAEKRVAGVSKYSLRIMLKLAVAGILSFSTKPLQLGIFTGIIFAGIAFLLGIVAVVNYFFDKSVPSGWTTVVTLLLLFGGVQLVVTGVMGVYIGGIYEQVRARPRYIVEEVIVSND